MKTQRSLDR